MKKVLIALLTIFITSSITLAGEVKTNDYTLTNKEIKQELNIYYFNTTTLYKKRTIMFYFSILNTT